ncbi:MAG: hypothetical protein MUP86_01140, partial [Dehalococcoidia bacterium]|nr:hypothetical protein [Dehalococcoidia bacterium]
KPAEREELLRELWWAHDGRWFLRTAQELGFDTANRLNQAVIRSMGKKEARELMTRTGAQIADIGDIVEIIRTGGEIYWPEEHKHEMEVVGESLIVGHVLQCYVWEEVNKSVGLAYYRCAAPIRFRGWVDAFGVPGEVIASKEIDECNGSCEISFRFDWPAEKARQRA